MSTIDSFASGIVNQVSSNSSVKETSNAASKYGNTIGKPELSDSAAKYYESLKSKYHNLEFVLVDNDSVDTAEQQASKYMSSGKTVVLLDAAKVEKMSSDKAYREKFEGIIEDGAKQIEQMSDKLSPYGDLVKGYGIRVNDDGSYTLFASLERANKEQQARIEKSQNETVEKRKEAAKEQVKKFRKDLDEHMKKASESHKFESPTHKVTKAEIVSASSIEELLEKISAYNQDLRMNEVQTQEEKSMGQSIDFKC